MIRAALIVSVVMCCHASGKQIVPSAMQVVEAEDDTFQMLYQKIVDIDAKMASMETKDMELERQISEVALKHASGKDVIENNLSSNLAYTRSQLGHTSRMAFFATLRADSSGYLGKNQVIIFDNLVTNYGGAYSTVHGYFFAPISGMYVFFLTVGEKYGTGTYYITVNGVTRGRLHVGAAGYQASQTLIIYLGKGSHVAVKNGVYQYDRLKGDYHTTFSGFLMY